MAHIGKLYKLQFRRDLSRERNNRNGYPEAFRWSQSNVTGAVAIDVVSNLVPMVNLATDSQPPMTWQSATRLAGGVHYNLRWIIDDPFNIPDSTALFVVRDLDHSVDLFSFPLSRKGYAATPSAFSGQTVGHYMDSSLWRVVAGTFFWNVAALNWANYNP